MAIWVEQELHPTVHAEGRQGPPSSLVIGHRGQKRRLKHGHGQVSFKEKETIHRVSVLEHEKKGQFTSLRLAVVPEATECM